MKRIALTAGVLLATSLFVGSVEAGNERRLGAAGAQELRIPVGTRGIALAGATVASSHGLESIYYNPAGLAATQGVEAYFGNTNYIADMTVRYFGLATKQSVGTLGLTAKVLDVGDLYVTTEEAPEGTGQIESLTLAVLGLSYARYLTDAISFGATGSYISENILNTSAHGVAFDLGLHYHTSWRDASFGVVMKNVGPNMEFTGSDLEYSVIIPGDDPQSLPRIVTGQSASFDLPSYFQLGGELRALGSGDHAVRGYGTYQSNNFSLDEFRGGAEYAYQDLLMLRGGYVGSSQDDYLYGATFGAGLNVSLGGATVGVDYAFQAIDTFFDDLHTFSASFRF